jgi:hypothetical protein
MPFLILRTELRCNLRYKIMQLLWRIEHVVALYQPRSYWRCAVCVQSKLKFRNAGQSSHMRRRSEFTLCPALLTSNTA